MKLYSWNVNGIRAVIKKGLFQQFISDHQPDILCLQETKAKEGQAVIDLPEYQEFWNSAEKAGYSGTAIFTKIPPLSVLNGFLPTLPDLPEMRDSFGDPTQEGRVITAEFTHFFVVTVYTPNSKSDLTRLNLRANFWDLTFLAHVKELEKKKPVLFCGDLNVAHTEDDLANPKTNKGTHGFTDEERVGFQRYVDAGFIDTFRLFQTGNGYYSWWIQWADARARNVGWRIDYWLASASLKNHIRDATIHADVFGSDHCPVSIMVDF
jgi:exodeoxyribonuclease III